MNVNLRKGSILRSAGERPLGLASSVGQSFAELIKLKKSRKKEVRTGQARRCFTESKRDLSRAMVDSFCTEKPVLISASHELGLRVGAVYRRKLFGQEQQGSLSW